MTVTNARESFFQEFPESIQTSRNENGKSEFLFVIQNLP